MTICVTGVKGYYQKLSSPLSFQTWHDSLIRGQHQGDSFYNTLIHTLTRFYNNTESVNYTSWLQAFKGTEAAVVLNDPYRTWWAKSTCFAGISVNIEIRHHWSQIITEITTALVFLLKRLLKRSQCHTCWLDEYISLGFYLYSVFFYLVFCIVV